MVSSSPPKREDVAANDNLNKSAVSLVPGPKPLTRHRFYLDVKNYVTSSKLEAKIKELGGLLELFLIREVTHVVTDREGWASTSKGGGISPRTPRTPNNQSSVYNDHGTPDECGSAKKGRPRTRIDAMLEKARKSTPVKAKDPLEQAKNWGITIWTVEKALIWLEKVTQSASSKKRKPKVKELKAPYVKFESFDRKYRPVFLEIRNWPRFNFHSDAGSTAVVHKSAVEQNMTRKFRAPHPQPANIRTTATAVTQKGYCEICRVEYNKLDEHLETPKHLDFVRNGGNFLDLDSLINDGSNIESFLKINVVANDDKCNGIDSRNCSPLTQKMPRTRTSSVYERHRNVPVSPSGGSDNSYNFRTRRNTMNSYIAFTADDDIPAVKPTEGARQVRELRSSTRNALLKFAEEESDTWKSGRPKRSCNKRRRITIDDNVISEYKGFYKIEVPKVPSAKPEPEELPEPIEEIQPPTPPNKSLIVKFKRMRTSELKQLSDEAENFLFPKKDESSSEEDIDGDCPNTTASTGGGESTLLLTSEDERDREEENGGSKAKGKKKRLTHAEAFILDNKKYYKFEMPGTRLRYHGSMMPNIELLSSPQPPPPSPPCNNGEVPVRENRKKEVIRVKQEVVKSEDEDNPLDKTESISQFNLAEHRFSFEQIPRSEPWYEPFSRQDQGVEFYTCFSDSGYWKPFLLPYQMDPPPPPLDPKICISAYAQAKKQIMSELSSGTNSATCSTHDDQSSSDVYTPDVFEETSKTSEDSYMEVVEDQRSKPRRSRAPPPVKSPTSKNPRKSPRQHASTLAILSSLIHQRKRRERSRNKTSERTLEAIPEVEITEDARENSVEREAKSIDDLLNGALQEFHTQEKLDIRCKKVNLLATDTPVDPIEILESYKNVEEMPAKQNPSKRSVPGKKPGRKKRNRTGWPNKNNRRIKKEIVTDDVESTIDVLSVFSDLDDEESCDGDNLKFLNGTNSLGVPKLSNFSGQIGQLVNKPDQSKDVSVNNVQNSDDRVISDCRSDRVVDLDRWENAEKVLAAKINICNTALQFQPYVKVQKLDEDGIKTVSRRLRNSSPPPITSAKRRRRMPASPKSPRELRKPRGRWYRER